MTDADMQKSAQLIKELTDMFDSGVIFVGREDDGISNGLVFGDPVRILENISYAVVALHSQFGYSYKALGEVLNIMTESAAAKKGLRDMEDLGAFSVDDLKNKIKIAMGSASDIIHDEDEKKQKE